VNRQDEIADLVQDLLDIALEHLHDRASEESFEECHLCGDVDGHAEGCAIPLLQAWQVAPQPKGRT